MCIHIHFTSTTTFRSHSKTFSQNAQIKSNEINQFFVISQAKTTQRTLQRLSSSVHCDMRAPTIYIVNFDDRFIFECNVEPIWRWFIFLHASIRINDFRFTKMRENKVRARQEKEKPGKK